jgi:hypothetical protein
MEGNSNKSKHGEIISSDVLLEGNQDFYKKSLVFLADDLLNEISSLKHSNEKTGSIPDDSVSPVNELCANLDNCSEIYPKRVEKRKKRTSTEKRKKTEKLTKKTKNQFQRKNIK